MNKFSNDTFLKDLINSEFIFARSSSRKKFLSSCDKTLKGFNDSEFDILNIFKLNQSLKQYIRILSFLKLNKKFKIYIWCSNKYLIGLTNKYLNEFSLTDFIKCSSTFPSIDSTVGTSNFLFVLGNPISQNSSKLINAKMLPNDILLLSKLNFHQERNCFGVYKIQNELSDYKKLLFLLVIMHNVIITKIN